MRTLSTVILSLSLIEICAPTHAFAQATSTTPPKTAKSPAKPVSKAKQASTAKKAAPEKKTPAKPARADPSTASKLPPPSEVYVGLGYSDWGLNGNESKFRQYATPPSGWFLDDFRYSPELRASGESAFVDLKAIGENDYRATTRETWDYGATQLSGFLTQSSLFDPSVGPIQPSARRISEIDFKRLLTRTFGFNFQYRRDVEERNYTSPTLPLDQVVDFWSVDTGGKLGDGSISLYASNLHFQDRTGTFFDSTTQTTGFSYTLEASKKVEITADLSAVQIQQPGVPNSHIDTVALGGDVDLGPSTNFAAAYVHRQLGQPNILNAYVQKQDMGTAVLSHRWGAWRADLGLNLKDDNRINGAQNYVDVPKWSTVEARLSGRLSRGLRFSLKASEQSLADAPGATTFGPMDDPSSLYFNQRTFVQARFEGGVANVNAYLTYTFQDNSNTSRSTEVQTNQYTIGATWQAARNLSVFAEFHDEIWSGHSDSDGLTALKNFLPDSTTGVIEVDWTLGPRAYVTLNYTGFATFNDNPLLLRDGNTHGSFLTIGGRYRFPHGYDLGLSVAPWTYRDTVVNALNYNATIVMLTAGARF